jgi:hypothetical protein
MHHVIVYTTLYWLYYLLSWRCYAMSLNYRNPSSRCTVGQYNAPQRRQRTDRYCLTHNNTVLWCTNGRVKICWPDEEHTIHMYVWYTVYAQQCEISVAHAAGDSLKQSLSMYYWLLCLIACCSWCCVMRTSMTSRCVTNVCMCLSSLWKMVYHIACHSVRYCGVGGVGSVRDNRCAHCCVSGRSLLKYVSTCCWYCTV